MCKASIIIIFLFIPEFDIESKAAEKQINIGCFWFSFSKKKKCKFVQTSGSCRQGASLSLLKGFFINRVLFLPVQHD